MTPPAWPENWISPLLPIAIVAAVGLALMVLGIMGPRLFRGTRSVSVRSLLCPRRHERFDVAFDVTAWEGTRVDVGRCTAFDPPSAIACDKECLTADTAATDGRPAGP